MKMGVNRLNLVQKATYLKKIKSGKNEECTVTVKTEKVRSKCKGLRARMAAELMIGFWF